MFGGNVVITPNIAKTDVSKEKPVTRTAAKPVVQSSISNYLLDSFLVSNIKKKERAKAKEKAKESV